MSVYWPLITLPLSASLRRLSCRAANAVPIPCHALSANWYRSRLSVFTRMSATDQLPPCQLTCPKMGDVGQVYSCIIIISFKQEGTWSSWREALMTHEAYSTIASLVYFNSHDGQRSKVEVAVVQPASTLSISSDLNYWNWSHESWLASALDISFWPIEIKEESRSWWMYSILDLKWAASQLQFSVLRSNVCICLAFVRLWTTQKSLCVG